MDHHLGIAGNSRLILEQDYDNRRAGIPLASNPSLRAVQKKNDNILLIIGTKGF